MSEWISVEHLPESMDKATGQSDYVLVVSNTGKITSAWYQHECMFQADRVQYEDYAIGWHNAFPGTTNAPLKNITHWCIHPEAPK